jgi:hypothetical protein
LKNKLFAEKEETKQETAKITKNRYSPRRKKEKGEGTKTEKVIQILLHHNHIIHFTRLDSSHHETIQINTNLNFIIIIFFFNISDYGVENLC